MLEWWWLWEAVSLTQLPTPPTLAILLAHALFASMDFPHCFPWSVVLTPGLFTSCIGRFMLTRRVESSRRNRVCLSRAFGFWVQVFLTHSLFGSFSHVRGVLTVVALGLWSSPRFCVIRGVQIRFGPLWNANLLAVFSSVHAGGLLILCL